LLCFAMLAGLMAACAGGSGGATAENFNTRSRAGFL
jgi:hypothetical protein